MRAVPLVSAASLALLADVELDLAQHVLILFCLGFGLKHLSIKILFTPPVFIVEFVELDLQLLDTGVGLPGRLLGPL